MKYAYLGTTGLEYVIIDDPIATASDVHTDTPGKAATIIWSTNVPADLWVGMDKRGVRAVHVAVVKKISGSVIVPVSFGPTVRFVDIDVARSYLAMRSIDVDVAVEYWRNAPRFGG